MVLSWGLGFPEVPKAGLQGMQKAGFVRLHTPFVSTTLHSLTLLQPRDPRAQEAQTPPDAWPSLQAELCVDRPKGQGRPQNQHGEKREGD